MNAPLLWIGLPLGVAGGLWLVRKRRKLVVGLATAFCLALVVLAWLAPLGATLRVGPISLNFSSTLTLLGRRLVLDANDRSVLILMYLFGAVWFFGSSSARVKPYFIPVGLAMIALMVAAQAVEPFLYAGLILELAVLISLPLLAPPNRRAGPGALRYLVFQTLAIPFIMLAGWAAGLVEANLPGDRWVLQAILFLALGFSLWLAVFPFYTWVPMVAQETEPYVFGFLLGLLPVGMLWIMLGFLDTYTWLRSSLLPGPGLQVVGALMVFTTGLWAAFQRNLARSLGYAILLENGYALLAMGLRTGLGLELLAAGLLPRLVGLALWALALAVLHKNGLEITLEGLRGALRRYPAAAAGLAVAYFSIGGLPLLASFAVRQPLIEALAGQSPAAAMGAMLGNLGFLIGGYRLLAALTGGDEKNWHLNESTLDTAMLLGGMIVLVLVGMFPGALLKGSLGLVQVFTHLR